MDTGINFFTAVWLLFLEHVELVLVVNVVDDWHPTVGIVGKVTKPRCINDGELDGESIFNVNGLTHFNSGCFRGITVKRLMLRDATRILKLVSKKSIDKGCFSFKRLITIVYIQNFKNIKLKIKVIPSPDSPATISVKTSPRFATMLRLNLVSIPINSHKSIPTQVF